MSNRRVDRSRSPSRRDSAGRGSRRFDRDRRSGGQDSSHGAGRGYGGGSTGGGRPDFEQRGRGDATSTDRRGHFSGYSSMDRAGYSYGSRDSSQGHNRGRGRFGGGGGGGGGGSSGQAFSSDLPKDICDQAPAKKKDQRGTVGEPIEIKTNFVRMRLADQDLYTYQVDFDPPVASRRKKMALVMGLKSTHQGQFIPDSMLISKKAFGNEKGELEVPATMKVRGENGPEEAPVKIRFKKTGKIILMEGGTEFMHLINNLAKSGLRKLSLTQIKQSFYHMEKKKPVDGFSDLSRVPSYEIPVHIRHGGFMMNISIRERLIRQDTVLDQMRRIKHQHRSNYHREAEGQLIGQIVQLKYSGRTFKIEDSEETVLQYYRKHFPTEPDAQITGKDQPLLIAEPTARDRRRENAEKKDDGGAQLKGPKKFHLVPELCRMTGLTDNVRNNPMKMRELAGKLRKAPQDCVDDCQGFIQMYGGKPVIKEMLQDFNLAMDKDIVSVRARQLKNISLTMGGRRLSVDRCRFENCLKGREVNIERKGTIKNWQKLNN